MSNEMSFQERLTQAVRSQLTSTTPAAEYKHTLKMSKTPGGISLLKVTASANKVSGNLKAGWPTPVASPEAPNNNSNCVNGPTSLLEAAEMTMAGWPTPVASIAGGTPEQFLERKRKAVANGSSMGICLTDLGLVAQLAEPTPTPLSGWPTPKAQEDGRTLEQYEAARQRGYEARKGKTSGGPASAQGGLAIAAQLALHPVVDAEKPIPAEGASTACTTLAGWPTPRVSDTNGDQVSKNREGGIALNSAAQLAGWPTPRVTTNEGHGNPERAMDPSNSRLEDTAQIAGWSTPTATDHNRGTAPPRQTDTGVPLTQQVAMAGWATPTTRDWKDGACQDADVPVNGLLGRQAAMLTPPLGSEAMPVAGWATPTASDKVRSEEFRRGRELSPREALVDSGTTTNSFTAGMARRGALNAALPRWLMAFPESWDHSSPSYSEWELIQKLLREPSNSPEVVWQRLAKIALEDLKAMGTQSASKRPRRS